MKGIKDLHRDKIDDITIPSKMGKAPLKRIEEVFDCWFESGRYAHPSTWTRTDAQVGLQHALCSAALSVREQLNDNGFSRIC